MADLNVRALIDADLPHDHGKLFTHAGMLRDALRAAQQAKVPDDVVLDAKVGAAIERASAIRGAIEIHELFPEHARQESKP